MIDSMWYVYIVKCVDGTLYTGTTTNPEQRVKTHNEGKGGNYTKTRTPVILVYNEDCDTHSGALRRESQIKRWSRGKKLALVSENKKQLTELSKSRD